jgi:hypothetical protein
MKKKDLFRQLIILFLSLAFCACRNAPSSGSYTPAIAHDPVSRQYLTVFVKIKSKSHYGLDDSRIKGRFVDSSGSSLGNEFVIAEDSSRDYFCPSVVFDSTHMKYLVIWNSENNIYGQFVNSDSSISSARLTLSTTAGGTCGRCAAVTYDDAAQKFAVVWGEQNPSSHDSIYAQLINSDGSLDGPKLAVSDDGARLTYPSIAYDELSQRFFAVWESADNRQIKGRMINPDGAFTAAEFPISSTNGTHYVPTVTYNSVDARFLVSWEHTAGNSTYDLLGQLLNADGSLYQSVVRISSPGRNVFSHASIYNPLDNTYFVLFGDRSHKVLYAQVVKSDGALDTTISNDNILISYADYPHDTLPAAAFDSIHKRFFSIWQYGLTDFKEAFPDIHGRLVNANGSPAGDISVVSNGGVW